MDPASAAALESAESHTLSIVRNAFPRGGTSGYRLSTHIPEIRILTPRVPPESNSQREYRAPMRQ